MVTGTYLRLTRAITANGANFAIGKGRVAATDTNIAECIKNALNWCQCDKSPSDCRCSSNHRIEAKRDMTMLGIDYSAGRTIGYQKNKERVNEAKIKASKIVSL